MKKYLSILCVLLLLCNVGFAQHAARVTLNTDAANYITQLGSILTITDLVFADDIAAFTSANFFGVVSNETGSGLLVGSIAPTFTTTIQVDGVSTLTGGVVYPTATAFIWAIGGASLLATSGTDQAPTNGPRQWVQVNIPYNVTLTGIGYMVGSVGGTDSVVVELYNSAGTEVASSLTEDTNPADIVGTTAQFQNVAFASTYAAVAGIYYISIQMNGTTARLRTYGVVGSNFVANTAAGTFKTSASITPGTTFVADEGPISYVY